MIVITGQIFTDKETYPALIARLRELLQQIVRHHDEAMRAAVGDEANYHQMRRNQVLFHLTPNAVSEDTK